MKSVKPGRGPSAMGAVGSVTVVIFGIFWIAMAVSMRCGIFSVVRGSVCSRRHHSGGVSLQKCIGKNRYSSFDIVEDREEPDSLNQRFGTGMQDGSYSG